MNLPIRFLRDDAMLKFVCASGVKFVTTSAGSEVERTYGWHRDDWQRITGCADLGADLPPLRPGCGSKTLGPGIAEELAIRFDDAKFASRQLEIGEGDDLTQVCFERG